MDLGSFALRPSELGLLGGALAIALGAVGFTVFTGDDPTTVAGETPTIPAESPIDDDRREKPVASTTTSTTSTTSSTTTTTTAPPTTTAAPTTTVAPTTTTAAPTTTTTTTTTTVPALVPDVQGMRDDLALASVREVGMSGTVFDFCHVPENSCITVEVECADENGDGGGPQWNLVETQNWAPGTPVSQTDGHLEMVSQVYCPHGWFYG